MSPNDKVSIGDNVYGRTSYLDRRSAAHLEATKAALPKNCTLLVIQGGYNTSVAASAGTHDYGAVVDVKVAGMTWLEAQRFLRAHGWAAWYRHPPSFPTEHVHMVSLGYTCRVGTFVPGQVTDYYAHAFGLAGQHARGSDRSWFPPDIASTVFDYDAYVKERDMSLREDIQAVATKHGASLPKVARASIAMAREHSSSARLLAVARLLKPFS